jgi:hypothetical protein
MMDIYEFPKEYDGRKKYVTVRGHSKSIPVIYTYHGVDGHYHLAPEYGGTYEGYSHGSSAMIMGFKEFRSPIDGKTISDFSQLSAHNRQHGVEQCGNEHYAAPVRSDMPSAGKDIVRAIQQHGG